CIPSISFGQTSTEIAKDAINSTISVIALDNTSQPLAYGSGFIIDDKLIATNVHVIEGASSAYVLINGSLKNLTVDGYVAIDKANDLVILKVSDLHGTKLILSSTAMPEIGEKIYAVGNPKGLSGTFSEGIVSGIREIASNKVIQITAPISPGSSGGPVLNSKGEVMGIAFASFSSGQNLNFAIPVTYLESLKSKISIAQPLSAVKRQTNSNTKSTTNSNLNEGVIVRNLSYDASYITYDPEKHVNFSIKNNLPYTVSDIDILILAYDNTGTVVDYKEEIYFPYNPVITYSDQGIKPYLAHTLNRVFS
ncbi:MAG: S1C family serine protease, partial [Flavobacterium sp.]